MMERLPADPEAEQMILGELMVQNTLFERVGGVLKVDDFAEPIHRTIYSAIGQMVAAGRRADMLTLKGVLGEGKIGDMTPNEYLAHLVGSRMGGAYLDGAVEAVRSTAVRRRIMIAAEDIAALAHGWGPQQKIEELVAECEARLGAAVEGGRAGVEDEHPIDRAKREIGEAFKRQASEGIPWAMTELQDVLGDAHEFGWLVGLLADSGAGKTSIALQQVSYAAMLGYPVLFLSGDQEPAEVYRQIASQRHSVQTRDLRRGRASQAEVEKVLIDLEDARSLPLEVRKLGRATTAEIGIWVRSFTRRRGRGLVVIDHAKRIGFTDPRANLAEGVSQVYGDLKALAQATESAILLLMQRNSDGARRDDPRPTRSDTYGGIGAFENLDGLIALYVEEQWTATRLAGARSDQQRDRIRARGAELQGKAELFGLKARFGESGLRRVIGREPRFTRFHSLTQDDGQEPGLGI